MRTPTDADVRGSELAGTERASNRVCSVAMAMESRSLGLVASLLVEEIADPLVGDAVVESVHGESP